MGRSPSARPAIATADGAGGEHVGTMTAASPSRLAVGLVEAPDAGGFVAPHAPASTQLRLGGILMLAGGALGLLSAFLPWFAVPGTGLTMRFDQYWAFSFEGPGRSLWAAPAASCGWLAILGCGLFAVAGIVALRRSGGATASTSKKPALWGLLVPVFVLMRFGFKPPDTTYAAGIFVCLVGSVILAVGCLVARSSEVV